MRLARSPTIASPPKGREDEVASRAVAQYVKEHTAATCSMFVWGFEPVTYDLAQRQPVSRYIYNLGQRVPRTRDALRAVMMQELERNEHCALLVEHTDVFPLVSGTKVDSAAELAISPSSLDSGASTMLSTED